MRKIDLTGMKFNRLYVIEQCHFRKGKDCIWTCVCDCGKKTYVRAPKLKSGHTKSCGCYRSDKRREWILKWTRSEEGRRFRSLSNSSKLGENALHWKGGKEPENSRPRRTLRAIRWRYAIYARDKHTCQKCGKTNCRLNAHHILSWSLYPEHRFDMDNGITLCKECHIEEHRIHGKPRKL